MLADGVDPIETKHPTKTQAAIKGQTFESAALDQHKAMSAKWAPNHAKTILSRLKTHVFPLIGARSIVDLDTHGLMTGLETERYNRRRCCVRLATALRPDRLTKPYGQAPG